MRYLMFNDMWVEAQPSHLLGDVVDYCDRAIVAATAASVTKAARWENDGEKGIAIEKGVEI